MTSAKLILLFSGPIAVGKSSVANILINEAQFRGIKTSNYLIELATKRKLGIHRTTLQELGDNLDSDTDFKWVIDDIAIPLINNHSYHDRWLLDSVRKPKQILHFKNYFGSIVRHIHFTASENTIKQRYERRRLTNEQYNQEPPYEIVVQHPNEVSSRNLVSIADIMIDLENSDPKEVANQLLCLP